MHRGWTLVATLLVLAIAPTPTATAEPAAEAAGPLCDTLVPPPGPVNPFATACQTEASAAANVSTGPLAEPCIQAEPVDDLCDGADAAADVTVSVADGPRGCLDADVVGHLCFVTAFELP